MTLQNSCCNCGQLQFPPPLFRPKLSGTLSGSRKAWVDVSGEPSLERLDGAMLLTV